MCRGHFRLLGYQKISNLEKTCVRSRFVVNDLILLLYINMFLLPLNLGTLATQLYLLKDLGHHMKDTTGEPHSMFAAETVSQSSKAISYCSEKAHALDDNK